MAAEPQSSPKEGHQDFSKNGRGNSSPMKSTPHKKGGHGSLWASLGTTLVMMTSLSVILIALRNTITLHIQQFWGASGDFWQQQWDWVLDWTGGDLQYVNFVGMVFVSWVVYWGSAACYVFMDVTGLPTFMRKYKVQPGTNDPVETSKLLKVVAVVNFNQLVLGPGAAWATYQLFTWRGFDSSSQLPSFHWAVGELIVFVLMEEVGFYYTHRLMHHRLLYRHIHKIHHEWQSPIAPVVLYCHPVEFFFSNVLPGVLGPLLTGCHLATFLVWVQIQILFSMHQHSGYHLPFMPSPEAHDYHHLKFTQCFGVLGVLDLLHGTDDRFRDSACYSRDIVSFSLTPVRQTFPDTPVDGKKKILAQ